MKMKLNRLKGLIFAMIMIPGLVFVGEAVPGNNHPNNVSVQTVTARSSRPSVGRRIYRGGRWVVRKTWNGTKWVYRKVWVATKWTGRKPGGEQKRSGEPSSVPLHKRFVTPVRLKKRSSRAFFCGTMHALLTVKPRLIANV
jgi:hypothetical protein